MKPFIIFNLLLNTFYNFLVSMKIYSIHCFLKYLYKLNRNMTTQQQTQQETKQLREVTDLLNSYQQKISLFNDEIASLKQTLIKRDKEIDQLRLQLKNLKRSRSSESSEQRLSRINDNGNNGSNEQKKQRSHSADTSETLARQIDIAHDEIRLLKNKITRLEDDLLFVTQVN
jgi:hypothetical protein